MLKMKFWFEGNQLQPDCNIHGGCKIGSSACHACPHCVRVNSKDQEVLCLGDGSGYKEVKLEELRVGACTSLMRLLNSHHHRLWTSTNVLKN